MIICPPPMLSPLIFYDIFTTFSSQTHCNYSVNRNIPFHQQNTLLLCFTAAKKGNIYKILDTDS